LPPMPQEGKGANGATHTRHSSPKKRLPPSPVQVTRCSNATMHAFRHRPPTTTSSPSAHRLPRHSRANRRNRGPQAQKVICPPRTTASRKGREAFRRSRRAVSTGELQRRGEFSQRRATTLPHASDRRPPRRHATAHATVSPQRLSHLHPKATKRRLPTPQACVSMRLSAQKVVRYDLRHHRTRRRTETTSNAQSLENSEKEEL